MGIIVRVRTTLRMAVMAMIGHDGYDGWECLWGEEKLNLWLLEPCLPELKSVAFLKR